jgi:hypothetical protein
MAQYQNISADPQYGFVRKVNIDKTEIGISIRSQYVTIAFVVEYFDANTEEPILIIPEKQVVLLADNTTNVDSNGTPLPDGAPGTPEFDYFRAAMGVPVVIDDMISAKITWADSIGRFN